MFARHKTGAVITMVGQTAQSSKKAGQTGTKWADFGKTCGQVPCKVKVFHGRQAGVQVVPNRGTAGDRYNTQAFEKFKPLIPKKKQELSTAVILLYYYDHVLIKEKE